MTISSSPKYTRHQLLLMGIALVALIAVFVWSRGPAAPPAPPPGYVSRALLGAAWPLTVDDGQLRCIEQSVTIVVDGVAYAVNGVAISRGTSRDLAPIWADDPTIPGAKKNIGPLIDRGLALCQ